ncbi:permease [Streptococcus sp. ZJ151]|uniref:permease n=1 Tax=Streptococcus jiangjianxini TaxID=3161189 RepID=UPI0032EB2800
MKDILLPKELAQVLSPEEGERIQVAITGDGDLLLKSYPKQSELPIKTWILILINSLISLICYLVLIMTGTSQLPLTGRPSIFAALLVVGGIVSLAAFLVGFIKSRAYFLNGLPKRIFWRVLPVIVLSFAVVLALLILGIAWVFGQLFKGILFDSLTASFLLGILSFILSFLMVILSERLRGNWLTSLFSIIIISGVVLAMVSNQNNQWWQVNLSFLGTSQANNSWTFNLALILSAMILLALIDYLFVALRVRYGKSKQLMLLQGLLVLLALDLGAVGYFPNDDRWHTIHTRVAGYLVYIIIALIVSIRWLLPEVSRDFLVASYTIGGLLVVQTIAFYGLGYLSLTAFEILSFLLAFSWIIMLLNRLEQLLMIEDSELIYLLKVSD